VNEEGDMKKKFVCFLLIIVLIAGCIVTPTQIRHRVRQMAGSVPQPKEGVELLLEILKDSSGSDCIGASYFWIYGSDVPLEDAIYSYQKILSIEGWKEIEINETEIAPQFRRIMLGVFQKNDQTLFIDRIDDLNWVVATTGIYSEENYLKNRAKEFEALFMLSISASSCER